MREWYRFLFSEVYETKLGEAFLQGSWAAGAAIIATLWVSRFAPGAAERPLLTTVFAVFGTLAAIAVWLVTYLECTEWLAPWKDREKRIRKPVTTPWRMGTSFLALAITELLFYFGPSAAIASVRVGHPRNPPSAPELLPAGTSDALLFWLLFALIMALMILQKAFAIFDPAVEEKRFSWHRIAKYSFVLVITVAALIAQTSSFPGLAFVFMPSMLGWYGTTSGPLERLTNECPNLRKALPRLLLICISHWAGWFTFWEGIMYIVLAYLPWPLAI